jgi:hypothetical protein
MRWLRNLFNRSAPAASAPPAAAPGQPPDSPGLGWDAWRALLPEGALAVALDLSLEPTAPDPARPRLLRVAYRLTAPGPDGLPSPAEGEALARVEDALSAAFEETGARYAGRVTLAGTRTHLFYAAATVDAAGPLAAAATALEGYQPTSVVEDDPTWSAWQHELVPPPRTRRWLEDRREVEALARHGVALDQPRLVDHQASFPSDASRVAFELEAAARGFSPVARRDDAPPPACFAVDLRRADPLTLARIHEVAWSLSQLATRHGGGYDGWEPASD